MYGPDEFSRDISVSRETLAQLKEFVHLLLRWQKVFNLVGSSTVVDIWRRHILDSAQIYQFLNPPVVWLIWEAARAFRVLCWQ